MAASPVMELMDKLPESYQHALDSGVYLRGVDTSRPAGRDRVPTKSVREQDPAVLLILGQSNGANHGETPFEANERVYNFNPFDACCYKARDPLLGATGEGGSPWCLLADALIVRRLARSVLLCPLAVGGSQVVEWAPGGQYHHRAFYCLGRLKDAGFWPTHVLWHQGEADALYGTSEDHYISSFRKLASSLRDGGVEAPIFVALAAYFAVPSGHENGHETVRHAQVALIDDGAKIYRGPDTDIILDRFDGCHMGTVGLRKHAEAWLKVLENHRRAGPVH